MLSLKEAAISGPGVVAAWLRQLANATDTVAPAPLEGLLLPATKKRAAGAVEVPPAARRGRPPLLGYFAMQVSAVSGVHTSRPV
jgi:hypothetical protein